MPEAARQTTTTIESPLPETKPPKTAREMLQISDDIRLAFDKNPDFERSFQRKKAQARVTLEGWMHGEISLDEATDIVAAQGAKLEMDKETDPLMDIPNRVALARIIAEQIALARREGKPLSIAFIDLDEFGDINKRYEEDAGDATLQAVGAFLKSELRRPTDKVGRRSGEELIVVLPDTEETGAMQVLEGMRTRMPENVADVVREIGGYNFDRPITMSAGIVTEVINRTDQRKDEEIMSDMLRKADERMRMAKDNGRNQVVDAARATELQETT